MGVVSHILSELERGGCLPQFICFVAHRTFSGPRDPSQRSICEVDHFSQSEVPTCTSTSVGSPGILLPVV